MATDKKHTMTASNISPQKPKKAAKNKDRADFTAVTVKAIAFEAHLFCSNPTCCRFTSYSTSSGKARAIAEAAHINAASTGGPRPSVKSNEDYLKSAANGIWLCKLCHDRIDKDPSLYSEAELHQWKKQHSTFVQQLVGKDFDVVHFELYARSRNVAQGFSILAFLEGKRVFFEALDLEYPDQVLESLIEVRSRITNAVGQMKQEEPAAIILREMNKKIRTFLTANRNLNELKCDGNDPEFQTFCSDVQTLRIDLLPKVVELAKDLEYTLSPDLINEYKRLEIC